MKKALIQKNLIEKKLTHDSRGSDVRLFVKCRVNDNSSSGVEKMEVILYPRFQTRVKHIFIIS